MKIWFAAAARLTHYQLSPILMNFRIRTFLLFAIVLVGNLVGAAIFYKSVGSQGKAVIVLATSPSHNTSINTTSNLLPESVVRSETANYFKSQLDVYWSNFIYILEPVTVAAIHRIWRIVSFSIN